MGEETRRFLGAVALAVGATSQAVLAGGAHSQKTPPDVPGFDGSTIKLGAITPQSGIASVVGKPLTEGNRGTGGQERQGRGGWQVAVELSIEDSQYRSRRCCRGTTRSRVTSSRSSRSSVPRCEVPQHTVEGRERLRGSSVPRGGVGEAGDPDADRDSVSGPGRERARLVPEERWQWARRSAPWPRTRRTAPPGSTG